MEIVTSQGISLNEMTSPDIRVISPIKQSDEIMDQNMVNKASRKEAEDNSRAEARGLPSTDQVRSLVEQTNRELKYTTVKYTYYEDINKIAIKVLDKDTQEVIREIPPEEAIEFLKKIQEKKGWLFDERR